ncbi:hypothetical protein [Actinomadura sp. CNU-125]|uniref:hypothetical protein n=1 Tax=Actinomadura sp. CNU-125 TaxID=1904961 RepID=UPI0021CCA750|nr:hypothetical protein [Actinomadura sp. CNU-125]
MRISFRERNPVPIAFSAFAVIILALALALNLERIPFVVGGTTYTAASRRPPAWSRTRRSASRASRSARSRRSSWTATT